MGNGPLRRGPDQEQRANSKRKSVSGTERLRTNVSGASYETCSNLPFGDGQACSGGADISPMHFTGKPRDAETNLDYFGARYYNSAMARWMSPDWADKPTAVPYAQFGNPQSLNLYGYVTDNPVSRQDGDGHLEEAPATGGDGENPQAPQPKDTKPQPKPQPPAGTARQQASGNAITKPSQFTYDPNKTGFGFGVQGGADAVGGVGQAGVALTGSVAFGAFGSNDGTGMHYGSFASGGGVAYAGNGAPESFVKPIAGSMIANNGPAAIGAQFGASGGFFFTNAGNSRQLAGPFNSLGGGISAGEVGGSFQFS